MLQCARFFALVKVRGFEQHQLTKGLQAALFLLLVPDASKLHPDSSQIFPRVEKLARSANNSEGLSAGYEIPTTQTFETQVNSLSFILDDLTYWWLKLIIARNIKR